MVDHLTLEVNLEKAAATDMLHAAEIEAQELGLPKPLSGNSSIGPFTVRWNASGSAQKETGTITLKAPGTVGLANLTFDYKIGIEFDVDLKDILGIPGLPTVPISGTVSDSVQLNGDCALHAEKDGSNWVLKLVVIDVLSLPIQASGIFLNQLASSISSVLNGIPLLGGLVEKGVEAILSLLGAGNVLTFLEKTLSEMINGFPIGTFPAFIPLHPQLPHPFENVQAEVDLQIVDLSASVDSTNTFFILKATGDVLVKDQDLHLQLRLNGSNQLELTPV